MGGKPQLGISRCKVFHCTRSDPEVLVTTRLLGKSEETRLIRIMVVLVKVKTLIYSAISYPLQEANFRVVNKGRKDEPHKWCLREKSVTQSSLRESSNFVMVN